MRLNSSGLHTLNMAGNQTAVDWWSPFSCQEMQYRSALTLAMTRHSRRGLGRGKVAEVQDSDGPLAATEKGV